MLFCMNETNLKRKEIRQCETRQKGVNPPKGDGEWARKSLFGEKNYYQWLQYQKNYLNPLGSFFLTETEKFLID